MHTYVYLIQTLEDFEEGGVSVDVHVAIFYRTSGVILLIWAQQDFYRTLSAGQMDGQALERGKKNSNQKLTGLHLIIWMNKHFLSTLNVKKSSTNAFTLNVSEAVNVMVYIINQ